MKVLVTAASRHHSTEQIAGTIARVLSEAGIPTAPTELERVTSLEGYDAVVLGSGVYAGRWLAEARTFTERFRPELAAKPLWLFSSGPLGDPPTPEEEPAEVATLAVKLGAVEHRVFRGRLRKTELGPLSKILVKIARAPYGDFRDFEAVEEWARDIAAYLTSATAP